MIYLPIKAQNTTEYTTGGRNRKGRSLLLQLSRNEKNIEKCKYSKLWTQYNTRIYQKRTQITTLASILHISSKV